MINKKNRIKKSLFIFLGLLVFFYIGYGTYGFCFLQKSYDSTVSSKIEKLDKNQHFVKKPLFSYEIETLSNLNAMACIIIDVDTGYILYEKNSDIVIPPASLTKIATLYTLFDDIKAGKKSLSDEVTIEYANSAKALPPRSSNMNLTEGQKVSVETLVMGAAVPSANDAAMALAYYDIGTNDENTIFEFTKKMNAKMQELSLQNTFFEDTTGLSDENKTTAFEYSILARDYILKYPENLEKYHRENSFSFPLEKNIFPYNNTNNFIPQTVTYKATNKVLNRMPECDGLKTGYTDVAGFNQATTATKDGNRFLSVTLGGTGSDYFEGLINRADDSEKCLNWAFFNFTTAKIPTLEPIAKPLRNAPFGFGNTIWLVETQNNNITVLKNCKEITRKICLPQYFEAPIKAGEPLCYSEYYADNVLISKIPLASTIDIPQASQLKTFLDLLTSPFQFLIFEK